MNIVLTGASSFTGLWFARALAAAGMNVVAPIRRRRQDYTGLRGQRIDQLAKVADVVEDIAFGSDAFLDLIGRTRPDVLCHHAAHVDDYRSETFDVAAALAANTANIHRLIERLPGPIVLTGSVFEPAAGAGSDPLRAFSPYGLSKAFTAQVFTYHCDRAGKALYRFMIPNPFGPFEEPRFCSYLIRTWARGDTAEVRTPVYVRDNIPVSLLALAYARYAGDAAGGRAAPVSAPSFYVETQGAFAERFAREMRSRLDLRCDLSLLDQIDFGEPMMRINTEPLLSAAYDWSESSAWDDLAGYYREGVLAEPLP